MTSLARRARDAYARDAGSRCIQPSIAAEYDAHQSHHGEHHGHMPRPPATECLGSIDRSASGGPGIVDSTDGILGAIPGVPEDGGADSAATDGAVGAICRDPVTHLDNGQIRPDRTWFYEVQTPDRRTVIRQATGPSAAVTSTWIGYRPVDGGLTLSAYEALCKVREVPEPSNDGYDLMRLPGSVDYRIGDLVTIKAQPWEGIVGVILYPHEDYATKYVVGIPDMGVPVRCSPSHIEMYQPVERSDAAPRMEDAARPGDDTMGFHP